MGLGLGLGPLPNPNPNPNPDQAVPPKSSGSSHEVGPQSASHTLKATLAALATGHNRQCSQTGAVPETAGEVASAPAPTHDDAAAGSPICT